MLLIDLALKPIHVGLRLLGVVEFVGSARRNKHRPAVGRRANSRRHVKPVSGVLGMHSFVHGGAHLVAHSFRGYPPDKLIDVLRNRNLLCLMLCNVIVVGSGNRQLAGSVGRLSAKHASVMPPSLG